MKKIILIILQVIVLVSVKAQIAVVTPGGSTAICPTLDSAISKANPNDIIYLPAGTFNIGNLDVHKRINIIGVGHNPDSTLATGATILNGSLRFFNECSNSLIDGVNILGDIYFIPTNLNIDSVSIFRTKFNYLYAITVGACSVFKVSQCVFLFIRTGDFYGDAGSSIINSTFSNNIFNSLQIISSGDISGNSFFNNIFLANSITVNSNNNFYNNIFLNWTSVSFNTNNFRNNIFGAASGPAGADSTNGVNNIYGQTSASTFINQSGAIFSYSQNYRLKAGSPGVQTGTDGSDRGIYGGTQPWKDGNIPPNPHIYLKNVAPQTGADGKLLIQYKVRANN